MNTERGSVAAELGPVVKTGFPGRNRTKSYTLW